MKKVLIIEDSSTVTKILKHLLKQHPRIQPLFAASFAESKAHWEQEGEDIFLAIVDLHLPDAPDGETVDYFLAKKLPVIVLTADYQDQRREALLKKGIVDYVIKENRFSYNYAINLIYRLEKNQDIKVLVVDDDRTARNFLRSLLELHLYQVLEAGDGNEALDCLKQNPEIKLLITDYHMPGMDGVELVRALRQNVDKSDLIIIGLSAHGESGLSAKFIKNGANDFLQKPFLHEELHCRVMHNIEELEMIERIRQAAYHDFLTNLHNRRYFFEKGEILHQVAVANDTELAIAMIDIDNFKLINDHHGHKGGDSVLRFVAEELQQTFSRFVVARIGGEEFSVLMPGLNNQQACKLLDGFRTLLSTMAVELGTDSDESLHVSISIGVSNTKLSSLDDQLQSAEQLLYRAKAAGLNMVIGDEAD